MFIRLFSSSASFKTSLKKPNTVKCGAKTLSMFANDGEEFDKFDKIHEIDRNSTEFSSRNIANVIEATSTNNVFEMKL